MTGNNVSELMVLVRSVIEFQSQPKGILSLQLSVVSTGLIFLFIETEVLMIIMLSGSLKIIRTS
jgi:hypothetical protein